MAHDFVFYPESYGLSKVFKKVLITKFKKNRTKKIIIFFDTWPIILSSPLKTISNIFRYYKNLFYHKLKGYTPILVLLESAVVLPQNYVTLLHVPFDKVFTWRDDVVDGKKYFKILIPYSEDFSKPLKRIPFSKKKFLTVIIGNKHSSFKNELYSERERAIDYFDKNERGFEFYGAGWNASNGVFQKLFGFRKYASYRNTPIMPGRDKLKTLSKYKFSICFENAKDIPGYITEKIWDCFIAGNVPVYYGAKEISKIMPNDTFIDRRNFRSYEELHEFLRNTDEKTYDGYMSNIDKFLKSGKPRAWADEVVVGGIINSILKDS